MKKSKLLQLVVTVSVVVVLGSCTKSNIESEKKDDNDFVQTTSRSSSVQTVKWTLGQLVRQADRLDVSFVLATVVETKQIDRGDIGMYGLAKFSVKKVLKNSSMAQLVDENSIQSFWSDFIHAFSSEELKIGDNVFGMFLHDDHPGHLVDASTGEEFSIHHFTCLPFAQDDNGFFIIEQPNNTDMIDNVILVEQARIDEAVLSRVIKNSIAAKANVYYDNCSDEQGCENICRTSNTELEATVAHDCAEGSCYYGAGCVEVKLLEQPDFCTSCGDEREPEIPGIIHQEVDGEEVCFDGITLAPVECP